jgi:hypothetical protein
MVPTTLSPEGLPPVLPEAAVERAGVGVGATQLAECLTLQEKLKRRREAIKAKIDSGELP